MMHIYVSIHTKWSIYFSNLKKKEKQQNRTKARRKKIFLQNIFYNIVVEIFYDKNMSKHM